ncbi:helix-turn-helix domain-containing protein [bacterium]|nr:helix-turn-helix domain-containing protein [bacterium]
MNDIQQEKTKQDIITQLQKTPIIEYACKNTGLGRSTFYRWRKDDESFANEVDQALTKGRLLINDMAESQLISGIKDKNMTAIIFWLKHNHKNYSTKIELSGKLKTEHKLSPEQEEEIKRALNLASLLGEPDES